MKKLAWVSGLLAGLIVLVVAGLIAFGTAEAPVTSGIVSAFRREDFATLPAVIHYRARDGAMLGYRRYLANAPATGTVLVLVHGAADSGLALHALAQSVAAAGVTVYVPEQRGHGASRPRGDIRYVGQLDDDLVDLVVDLRGREGRAPLRLAGFSTGGGFALKFAGGPHADVFAAYLLLAPGLAYQGPVVRPKPAVPSGATAFTVPYVPRLVGLAALNALGVHALDGLPVVAFAVPPDSATLTRTYSLRMLNNLVPADYVAAIAGLKAPTSVYIGADDEFSVPGQVVRAFGAKPTLTAVYVLPGVNHMGLVTGTTGIAAIRAWAASR